MENLINAIFDQFIRRDVFAKIGPGFVLLFAVLVFVVGWRQANDIVLNLSSGGWFAATIIAWITGLAIQSLGEMKIKCCKLIRYYPKKLCGKKVSGQQFRELTEKFRNRSDYKDRNPGHERLVVIKEACGIGCVSVLLSSFLLGAHYLIENLDTLSFSDGRTMARIIIVVILDLSLIWSLYRMHRRHAKRQWNYMRSAVDQPDTTGSTETGI